ncbi:serine hydrolase domain-containing protein [Dyadobacter fermentans]|uniref:serine hydrolase domain-containing protein n=1 Tax=Dyadobacter fermentans TaxID=94254 RepID=UPI001CBFC5CC|nr:serine hydrolase domain-containing protein [Dyadobacter fermentans]MBZ1359222.1 serine hydrolase [Dyadobacter fermentans]
MELPVRVLKQTQQRDLISTLAPLLYQNVIIPTMQISKKTINAVLFQLLLIANVKAQDVNRKLDLFFTRLAGNQKFSGNILVADKGKVVYEESFGYADFPTRTPNTKRISFPIASISKTFTATGILQLAEQGKLKVSDPVKKYLPGFPYPQITIQHLLSHCSGLPPYNAYLNPIKEKEPDKIFTNVDVLPAMAAGKISLIYEPGERGNYDNVNYIILALLIERLSGMTYADYIQRKILDPAGMKHTTFLPLSQQFNTDTLSHFSYPHLYLHLYDETPAKCNTIPYVQSYWKTFALWGFGDYVSTVGDLLKYDEALYSDQLLKPETLHEAFEPVTLTNGKLHPDLFGLGWEIEKDTILGKTIYHSGAAVGLSCVIMRNITRHQTVIVFDNTHTNAHAIGTKVLGILNGQSVEPPKTSIARVYGQAISKHGVNAAKTLFDKLRKDTLNYYLDEEELNQLGYDFLGKDNPYHLPESHRYQEALETFKLNAEMFPSSWNTYDSLGEALLTVGRTDEAAAMYRKSLKLNPNNESGIKALEAIEKNR